MLSHDRRVGGGAPADTALGHRRTAVSGHHAAAHCVVLDNVGHGRSNHRGQLRHGGHVVGGEGDLLSVGRAEAVGGVSAGVVGGVRGETAHQSGEAAHTGAFVRVCAGDCRLRVNTPADAAFCHGVVAHAGHDAAAVGRCLGDVADHRGGHHRGALDVWVGECLHRGLQQGDGVAQCGERVLQVAQRDALAARRRHESRIVGELAEAGGHCRCVGQVVVVAAEAVACRLRV